ncbi:MAG: hypothetical protein WC549_00360 [Actinomycetota bacterium]
MEESEKKHLKKLIDKIGASLHLKHKVKENEVKEISLPEIHPKEGRPWKDKNKGRKWTEKEIKTYVNENIL